MRDIWRQTVRATLSLVISACVLASTTSYAQESSQPVQEKPLDIDTRITELTDRIKTLEKELLEARVRLERLQEELVRARNDRDHRERDAEKKQEEEREALSKIVLPENATRWQISLYIHRILAASVNQAGRSTFSPQLEMFVNLGPENLDLLLDAMETDTHAYGNGRQHLSQAIGMLIDPTSHKQLILDHLAVQPELISYVQKYGWLNDAKPILLDACKCGDYQLVQQRMGHWYTHIASLKDSETYPALIQYMESSSSPTRVYVAIKDLPGIQLDEAVDRAWGRVRVHNPNGYSEAYLGMAALEHGNPDALAWLIELLGQERAHREDPLFHLTAHISVRDAILKHIDYAGSNEQILEWYYKYKDRLVFDKQKKVFKKK